MERHHFESDHDANHWFLRRRLGFHRAAIGPSLHIDTVWWSRHWSTNGQLGRFQSRTSTRFKIWHSRNGHVPKSPVPQMWGPTPSTEPSRVEKLPHLLQLFGTNVNQVKVKPTIMQNQLTNNNLNYKNKKNNLQSRERNLFIECSCIHWTQILINIRAGSEY